LIAVRPVDQEIIICIRPPAAVIEIAVAIAAQAGRRACIDPRVVVGINIPVNVRVAIP
jgi:hypothetical protein